MGTKETVVKELQDRLKNGDTELMKKIEILDAYGFSYSELLCIAADFYNQKVYLEKQLEETQNSLKSQKLGRETQLNGWDKQVQAVRTGKRKPAYRNDITPELVAASYRILGSKQAVADKLGISVKTVRNRLKEAGQK